MDNNELSKKGLELIKKGDSELAKFNLLFKFFNNVDTVMDKYKQAANNFKMAKDWENYVRANMKCISLLEKTDKQEKARLYVESGMAMEHIEPLESLQYYLSAVDIYCEEGKFLLAAKILESIGEIYKKEEKINEAVQMLKKAADFYQGENSISNSNKCLEKVAIYSTLIKKYEISIKTFEELGFECIKNEKLNLFSAKKHFMHAIFCMLAREDNIAAQNSFIKYSNIDFTFSDSREGKLCCDLIDAMDKQDSNLFSEILYEYDNISKLNNWETSILLDAKESMIDNSEIDLS